MRFFLSLLLFITVVSAQEDTCYSVQLISATQSDENYERLSSVEYDSTCKLLNINNMLTVRCGCYESEEEAHGELVELRQFYPDAYINKTYRFRFAKQKELVRKIVPTAPILKKEVKPFAFQDEYDRAMRYYNAKQYHESYAILSKIYLYKLSDPELNFYLGKSAYEIGHYEVALASFERVELLDPANLRNKLEMARTYYMLKMYVDAELAFKDVLEGKKIPKEVKENIEFYLSRVTEVQKKSFTYANINADWIYDSNVNYASIDSQYTTSIGTFPTTAKVSDSAIQLYGSVTNLYDIGEKDAFYIKNRVTALYKDYRDQNAYDLRYISYTPSLLYGYLKHVFEFGIGVDDLTLAKQDYLHSVFFVPSYGYEHTTTLTSMIYMKYQRKFFQRASEYDLNADRYELGYSLKKTLSPREFMQGGVVGIKEKKHHGNRNDVNYNEYKTNIFYTNQFSPLYSTELYGEYMKRDYADPSTLFGSTREDDGMTLSATLNRNIDDTLKLHLKGAYNRVHSNQNVFSYNKHTISLGLNKVY